MPVESIVAATVEASAEPTLEVFLLATVVGQHPRAGRATLRDGRHGRVTTLASGDALRPDLLLMEVYPEAILLSASGVPRRLEFGLEPVVLRSDDVLYPDLDLGDDLSDSMADAVALPEGPHHERKRPHLSWGTPKTVAALLRAFDHYHRAYPGTPPVHVGDLSAKDGGPLPPHVSHRGGRDVDLGYVLLGRHADTRTFVDATARNLDRDATWGLLDALLASESVAYIFMDYDIQAELFAHARSQGLPADRLARLFQYPRGPRAARGIIRHWPGHRGHFHVRFEANPR